MKGIVLGIIALIASLGFADGEMLYKQGLAVYGTDPAQACVLFVQAAEEGYPQAMVGAGHCYETGTGTATNYADAIMWYEKAAGHNAIKACEGLARIYATALDPEFHDGERAVKYASVVATKSPSDPQALSLLAAAYARNMEFDKAIQANEKACKSAESISLFKELKRRAELYYANEIAYPAVDTKIAVMLALKEIEKDSSNENLESLAMAYFYDGQLDKAVEHMQKVTGHGKSCEDSFNGEAYKYATGQGAERDYQQALKLYFKSYSSGAGMGVAATWIGMFFRDGKGVGRNHGKAVEWFRRGMDGGHDVAYQHLIRLYLSIDDPAFSDPDKAVDCAEQLLTLVPDTPEGTVALLPVAEAYAQTGRFDEAIQIQQRVIDAYKQLSGISSEQLEKVQQQLEAYNRHEKPYS